MAFDDFRIHQSNQRISAFGHVDNDHLLVHVDLRCGEADAGCGVHGFGQIARKLLQPRVENGDRCSDFMEPCVRIAEDVQD